MGHIHTHTHTHTQAEGRIMELKDQLKDMQDVVVGEEVLRRSFGDKDARIAALEPLQEQLQECMRKQREHEAEELRFGALVAALGALAGVSEQCQACSAPEQPLMEALEKMAAVLADKSEDSLACKGLLEQAVDAGKSVCAGLAHQRAYTLKLSEVRQELERAVADADAREKAQTPRDAALKLEATQAKLAAQELQCRILQLEKDVAGLHHALEAAARELGDEQRRREELEEAYKSADRLLLASRAQCASRAAQLEECVVQLSALQVSSACVCVCVCVCVCACVCV